MSVVPHVVVAPVDVPVAAMAWGARVRPAVVVVLVATMIAATMAATVSAVAMVIAITAAAMGIAAVVAVVVVALGSADQWAVVPATRDVAPVVLLAATTMVVHPSAAGNYPFLAWC